jgi:hypothetical protein
MMFQDHTVRPYEMTSTKSHTRCQTALAAHVQSQPKSMLNAVYAEIFINEIIPHRTTDLQGEV